MAINTAAFNEAYAAFGPRVTKIGMFLETVSPTISGILGKLGTAFAVVVGVFGFKWAAGDTAFYVGMGFIALLAFFAVYLYLR